MNLNQELKIADIVSENIRTADIFKKYGIDFCCGGGITVAKACEKKNIDVNALMNDLTTIGQHGKPSQDFNSWKLDFLADYIVHTHHAYVLSACSLLDDYASKVAKVHGAGFPPVVEIYRLYNLVKSELMQHMQKEERILFPYIKKLVRYDAESMIPDEGLAGRILQPIAVMRQEHENAGALLRQIAGLTDNYNPPDWACNTMKALYAKLDEFEQDLHLHVHLENNILFPKAIALAGKLSLK